MREKRKKRTREIKREEGENERERRVSKKVGGAEENNQMEHGEEED